MQDDTRPVHRLLDRLLNERLKAIEAMAEQEASGAIPSGDQMRALSELQLVITAINDEIARHEVHMGHGAEKPLA